MPIKSLLFLLVVFAISFGVYLTINKVEGKLDLPVYGEEGQIIAPFSFTNQNNETVTREDVLGKILVVDYIFTNCPSVCPKMTRNLQGIHDIVRQDETIQLLSFTVDPERDTPERLKEFADLYNVNHDSWYFLTGDKKELYRLARKSFYITASEGAGDKNDFIHSENVVLVDPQGRVRGIYVGTDEANINQCLEDIKKLKQTYNKS